MHVVEAMGGGVQTAVNYWTSASTDCEHLVLARVRPSHQTIESIATADFLELPDGHFRRMRAIREAARSFGPDVIHAHSSIAGVYTRLNPGISRIPIVYSPHCFAFERTDISTPLRRLLRTAESLMTLRTKSFVTVSHHESKLAQGLLQRRPCHEVPVFRREHPRQGRSIHSNRVQPTVVAMGRICPQKDPKFMASAMRIIRDEYPSAVLVWVGDGDEADRQALESAGARITGWAPRELALKYVKDASVFVHSAAWEGSPVVIEEALSAGVPVVARWLPVLEDRGLDRLAQTPEELARMTLELLRSDELQRDARRRSLTLASTQQLQAGPALRQAYQQTKGGTG